MSLIKKTRELNALYVEDDPMVRNSTLDILEDLFRRVYMAKDGQEGLKLFHDRDIQLVICDIRMPKMDGLEMAAQIRKSDTKTPILITSSHSEREELMEAIPLNITDYLIKPFTFERLQKALHPCLERIEESGVLSVMLAEGVSYNPLSSAITTPDGHILVSGKERALLELLIQNRGRVVHHEQIEEALYGEEFMPVAALKNLVYKLRKKVGKTAIANVHNTGLILH